MPCDRESFALCTAGLFGSQHGLAHCILHLCAIACLRERAGSYDFSARGLQGHLRAGQGDLAADIFAKLHKEHPTCAAVAIKHAEMLRGDAPADALRVLRAWLTDERVLPGPSSDRAAVTAAVALARGASGDIAAAVEALDEAVAMAKTVTQARKALRMKHRQGSTSGDPADWPGPETTRAKALAELESRDAMQRPDFGAGPGGDLAIPKLHVGSAVSAASTERWWLQQQIAAARIAVATALVASDVALACKIAEEVVEGGRMQAPAHEVAARAYVASKNWVDAAKHLAKGLKIWPNHGGLLQSFARMLRAQGRAQDAVLVATYARGVTARGKVVNTTDVRRAYADLRIAVLGT